jgi:hypothetical protein
MLFADHWLVSAKAMTVVTMQAMGITRLAWWAGTAMAGVLFWLPLAWQQRWPGLAVCAKKVLGVTLGRAAVVGAGG